MRIQQRDAAPERRILTAMITDSAALGTIAAQWVRGGLFKNKWANLVGGWAVRYFAAYDRAPSREIEGVFERESERLDADTVKLVDAFLGGLSGEYERNGEAVPTAVITDLAAVHFNRVKMLRAAEEIQTEIENGRDEKAAEVFSTFGRINFGLGGGIDVCGDKNAVQAAFSGHAADIVTYPEAAGNFFKHTLTRNSFVSFWGVSGVGKTWWLIDLAWRAMREKRRVAFFEIGDLSQDQIMKRFMVRAARRPAEAGTFAYPVDIKKTGKGRYSQPETTPRKYDAPLDWKTAWAAAEKWRGKTGGDKLRLSCHANNSIDVAGVVVQLRGWETKGWVPDVVVIDYADLLQHRGPGNETWDQIAETWKNLRSLSTDFHCLLVTATQANATALGVPQIQLKHFSGARQKIDHCTAIVGISQTSTEKRNGIMRLNWLKVRESFFDPAKSCHCAGALALGNPVVKSIF